MRFLTAAYATEGVYEELLQFLVHDLEHLGMIHRCRIIENQGSWRLNCHYKAVFIRETMGLCSGPILFLDADARIYRYPAHFDDCPADVAVHYFNGTQLASGTLFFQNNERTRKLVDAWIHENEHNKDLDDQQNLQTILEYWRDPGLSLERLPAEYCKIIDLTQDCPDPIIEHFQASRRYRW